MNHRQWTVALLTATVLLAAGTALGQLSPVAANSIATLNSPQPVVSIWMLPNGTGAPLLNCYGPGGVNTTATITVTLFDASGLTVPNYPQRNIRLEHMASTVSWCSNAFYPPPPHAPNCADGPTNLAGQTTFTLAYHGGGQQFQNCRV